MEIPSFHSIISSSLFTFVVGDGNNEDNPPKSITVHSAAITNLSPALSSLIEGGMSESIEKKAVLDDVDALTFARVCQFAYCGDYSITLDQSEKDDYPDDKKGDRLGLVAQVQLPTRSRTPQKSVSGKAIGGLVGQASGSENVSATSATTTSRPGFSSVISPGSARISEEESPPTRLLFGPTPTVPQSHLTSRCSRGIFSDRVTINPSCAGCELCNSNHGHPPQGQPIRTPLANASARPTTPTTTTPAFAGSFFQPAPTIRTTSSSTGTGPFAGYSSPVPLASQSGLFAPFPSHAFQTTTSTSPAPQPPNQRPSQPGTPSASVTPPLPATTSSLFDDHLTTFRKRSYPVPIDAQTLVQSCSAKNDSAEALIPHARIYVFADKYGIASLKLLVLNKMHTILSTRVVYADRLISLIDYVYESTPDLTISPPGAPGARVEGLNELVVGYAVCHVGALGTMPLFTDLLESGGSFVRDLWRLVHPRIL
ncbi:hypothetical protein MMC25_000235 [Agyrium rufum]|nr:hypothetical protein [Agyrium rufum]